MLPIGTATQEPYGLVSVPFGYTVSISLADVVPGDA